MWYLSTLCFWFLQSKTFNCYHVAIIGFSRPPHWPQYNAVQSKHYLKDCQLNLRTAKHHAEQGRQAVLDSSQEQYQHTARLIQVLLTLLWEEMDYCVQYSIIYRFWPQFRSSEFLDACVWASEEIKHNLILKRPQKQNQGVHLPIY